MGTCAVAVCPPGLMDKVTTCTVGTTPPCAEGCGPDLPSGSGQPTLGTKTCTCTAGVYDCMACAYESPLPGCYQPSAVPPVCGSGVADKASCTTPCTGNGTGNDVCTFATSTGKSDGCVCIQDSTGPVWTCQTQWW
jgi:hypothetical protein